MPRVVTHQFTLDKNNIYIVNNGVITTEPKRGPIGHYADSGNNVGYLGDDKEWALRIRSNNIDRIKMTAFLQLREKNKVSKASLPGVISITYDAEQYPDSLLGSSTQYKLADRERPDFADLTLGGQNNKPPQYSTTGSNVSDLVQDLAMRMMGRPVDEDEIIVYESIINAIDNRGGQLELKEIGNNRARYFDNLIREGTVLYNSTNPPYLVAVPDSKKLHFMRRAAEMYEGSKIVNGSSGPSPMDVAASAMNLDRADRERIGLVNQGIPARNMTDNSGTHRRFGAGAITVGSFHRPSVPPVTDPVIQEDTSAYYSALVLRRKFTKYQKPIGVKSKVCVDKRFPMYAVPMIIDDMLGYAYLKQVDRNVAVKNYIPVATPVEGTYWMFHNMENGKGITFYPDVLTDVICNNKNLFPEIDLTGKIRIAVNNFGNLFTEDQDENKKKEVTDIYADFFKKNPKFFHIMKIDWNTGFVIALSEECTPVLLMAAMLENGYVEYPRYMTVIPISGSVGFAAVGLSASEVGNIEMALKAPDDEDDISSPLGPIL